VPLPDDAGVVIVEPVQGRAGARVPPEDFLPALREHCDEMGALLVVDAIFTGLGRIGEMWPGSEVADVLCVGKALGGGLPISAALFVNSERDQVWDFGKEDLYTHTHSGNPLACAAALVVLEEVPKLLSRIDELSHRFAAAGWHGKGPLRTKRNNAAHAHRQGVLVIPIPAAEDRHALMQAAPPYTLTDEELDEAFRRLSGYGGGPGGPGGGGASSSSTTVRR
jgi:acetylornithine/succinyldiaminopimelate/putrescine aminotransferase